MDSLLKNSVELSLQKTPAEKLAEALEMMSAGIRLKLVALRTQNQSRSEEEIDAMLTNWLARGA